VPRLLVNMRFAFSRFWRALDWGLVVLIVGFLGALPYHPRIPIDPGQIWQSLPMIGRATSPPERFLEAIRDRPPLLRAFLQQFPKGGNLHVHLSGAVYIERLIDFWWEKDELTRKNICVTGQPVRMVLCKRCAQPDEMIELGALLTGKIKPGGPMPSELQGSFPLERLIDSLTLRNFEPGDESSPDQFFGAFARIGPLLDDEAVQSALKELQAPGNAQGLQYFEVMVSLQNFGIEDSATKEKSEDRPPDKIPFSDLAAAHIKENTIPAVWPAGGEISSEQMKALGVALDNTLHDRAILVADRLDKLKLGGCADDACSTDLRFIQQINRASNPAQFYAQLIFARELLRAEGGRQVARVVGLNIVSPEHGRNARISVNGEMAMIRAVCDPPASPCHDRVALHAGELAVGMVPPVDLQDHIAMAVDAGARRVGHGVMIGAEATRPDGPPLGLFGTLASRRVAVEINLSSNRTILHISGPDHPLRDYIGFGVPVVISTDDEGINRSDVTNEWVQAVSEHQLAYPDLVRMARNSLEYSFLQGESLWDQNTAANPAGEYRRASPCRGERFDTKKDALVDDCRHLLESSEKARHQWRLEKALADFAAQKWDDLERRLHQGLAKRS
jgi:adenosine deaminase